jgi:hypothetical protein
MPTVRKLIAAMACTALLSVVGVTAAGAQDPPNCARVAKITERIEAKKARLAARAAKKPRANASQQHKADFQAKVSGLEEKLADLQARCSD